MEPNSIHDEDLSSLPFLIAGKEHVDDDYLDSSPILQRPWGFNTRPHHCCEPRALLCARSKLLLLIHALVLVFYSAVFIGVFYLKSTAHISVPTASLLPRKDYPCNGIRTALTNFLQYLHTASFSGRHVVFILK